jgi:hypothetical protein
VQPWTRLFAETNGGPIRVAPDVDAPVVLLTTSGTTGRDKARNLVVVVLDCWRNSADHDGQGDPGAADLLEITCLGLRPAEMFGLLRSGAAVQQVKSASKLEACYRYSPAYFSTFSTLSLVTKPGPELMSRSP